MHLGDKYTACEKLNNKYVQELRNSLPEDGNAIGEASVRLLLSSDDSSEKVRFQRVGRFNVTHAAVVPVNSKFTIMHYVDGEWNSIETEEDTLALVKKHVPEEIHEYIFFDGEHLDAYFKAGQAVNVRNGIEELTQAKILEKAENAFNAYLTGVLSPQLSKSSDKDISSAQIELDGIQDAIDYSSAAIYEYTTQINACDNEIANFDSVINGHVNVSDKTTRLKTVEGLIDEYKVKIDKQNAKIMTFVREYTQYFAMYSSIKSLFQYIKEQDKHGKLPPRIDKFLLDSIEQHKHCCVCDQPLSDHSFNFIEELKKELEVSSETSALLNKTVVLLRQYLSNITTYKKKRDLLLSELAELKASYDGLMEEERQINVYLMSIPNTDEISKAIEQKKEFRKTRDEIIAKRGVEEAHKNDLEEQYSNQEKKLKSLIEKNHQLEKVNAQSEYCKKCRNIIKQTRLDLLSECRAEMEKETFEMFNSLLWKKDAFSKVEILEDYNFRLLDNYGFQTLGSCSAAERALLALSFTLALQKVSMHDSLLFIDTPIGRVDSDNRLNFVETLCRISNSKQVILTFTPTEYDSSVSAALADKHSTFHTLTISDGITTII